MLILKTKTNMKRLSFLLIIGVFVLLMAGAYSGYQFWQKARVEEELKKTEKSLAELRAKAADYAEKNVVQAVAAKKLVADLKQDSIQWSTAVQRIISTLPVDNGEPTVQILSYSGSANNEVSLNIKTVSGREEPYFDVADLIAGFDKSQYFSGPFVPAISGGIDEKGREVLTFLLNIDYRNLPQTENKNINR